MRNRQGVNLGSAGTRLPFRFAGEGAYGEMSHVDKQEQAD